MSLGRPASRWLLWVEVAVLLAMLFGLGIVRFSRLTPAERQEIQLQAGLLQLYELEADHARRLGTYFAPDDPIYRDYLPWMERYDFEARHDPQRGFSVVVRADLDGDGEFGAWRIDQSGPEVEVLVAD